MNPSLTDYLKSAALYILPHHFISCIIFRLTRIKSPLVPKAIELFSKAFKVNLEEAVNPDPNSYETFNDFFTREIKAESRPLSVAEIISPVDGTISQYGKINQGSLVQAKGREYSVNTLLGGEQNISNNFVHGQFITIYLSPKDYHRIHMPCSGVLKQQIYIPGRLFSVAPHSVKTVANIFARNERVVALFNTEYGMMAMVLVGAINVAAIETVWDGLVTPVKDNTISNKTYENKNITLDKGKEMGRFNMGSTVILLLENTFPELSNNLAPDQSLKLGESLAE